MASQRRGGRHAADCFSLLLAPPRHAVPSLFLHVMLLLEKAKSFIYLHCTQNKDSALLCNGSGRFVLINQFLCSLFAEQ